MYSLLLTCVTTAPACSQLLQGSAQGVDAPGAFLQCWPSGSNSESDFVNNSSAIPDAMSGGFVGYGADVQENGQKPPAQHAPDAHIASMDP